MGSGTVAGKRILVIGASAGIGRSLAQRAIEQGAHVVVAARRQEALDELVTGAGGGVALTVDVTDPASRTAFVASAVAELGAIDLVVHTVGYAQLGKLQDCDADLLRSTFEVNVVALHELARALVPHVAPGGIFGVLSSESAQRPRPGLVAYAASKAALEVLLEGWRIEHPSVRFSCAAVGATFPTEFGRAFADDVLGPVLDLWQKQGFMQSEMMPTDGVGEVLLDTYAAALDHPGIGIEHLRLRSPSPVAGTLDEALGQAGV